MRTAPTPQGPWGPEQMVVSHSEIPGGIYAPFLHPWSTGKELYYNLSLWSAYNVMLMHTLPGLAAGGLHPVQEVRDGRRGEVPVR